MGKGLLGAQGLGRASRARARKARRWDILFFDGFEARSKVVVLFLVAEIGVLTKAVDEMLTMVV